LQQGESSTGTYLISSRSENELINIKEEVGEEVDPLLVTFPVTEDENEVGCVYLC
jgi:hypothetical protein